MGRQETDWGEIIWLEDKKDGGSVQGLETGIVTLNTGAHQPKHVHYEEQVIYVLQGEARSIIDGEESILSPGSLFHWEAGVVHEIFNTGGVPLKHLLISNPVVSEPESLFSGTISEKRENEEEPADAGAVYPELIYVAVEAIRTQFLETLHYGYAIFDPLGNLILQSRYMPEFCEECCHASENPGKCPCMLKITAKNWGQEQTFRCPNGMEVFHDPIYFRNIFLGYLQSGYIRHESRADGRLKEVYDVPESVIRGIKALMQRIVKAIRNYCEFEQFRKELTEKELKLATNEEARRVLMKNLQETQYAVTDLKINHHFLFNTLNSMASMALDSGSMTLYQSIVDLSKMFHYTLRGQNSIVPLSKELEYVNAYLQLQKLRYGDGLNIIKEISPETLDARVPFNFLQPVAENIFTHGFDDCECKKIRLSVNAREGRVQIRMVNSGKRLLPENIRMINQGIRGNTSHGLSMVYRKLQAVFGGDFVFEISSLKNGQTCFLIEVPYHVNERVLTGRLTEKGQEGTL